MAQYATKEEADAYFSLKLHSQGWLGANPIQKDIALQQATRQIDFLNFAGVKTDTEQELKFPRYPDVDVPEDIKRACMEEAYVLLVEGKNLEQEKQLQRISSTGYSSVRSTVIGEMEGVNLANGIISWTAWSYLMPYLVPRGTIKLNRIS